MYTVISVTIQGPIKYMDCLPPTQGDVAGWVNDASEALYLTKTRAMRVYHKMTQQGMTRINTELAVAKVKKLWQYNMELARVSGILYSREDEPFGFVVDEDGNRVVATRRAKHTIVGIVAPYYIPVDTSWSPAELFRRINTGSGPNGHHYGRVDVTAECYFSVPNSNAPRRNSPTRVRGNRGPRREEAVQPELRLGDASSRSRSREPVVYRSFFLELLNRIHPVSTSTTSDVARNEIFDMLRNFTSWPSLGRGLTELRIMYAGSSLPHDVQTSVCSSIQDVLDRFEEQEEEEYETTPEWINRIMQCLEEAQLTLMMAPAAERAENHTQTEHVDLFEHIAERVRPSNETPLTPVGCRSLVEENLRVGWLCATSVRDIINEFINLINGQEWMGVNRERAARVTGHLNAIVAIFNELAAGHGPTMLTDGHVSTIMLELERAQEDISAPMSTFNSEHHADPEFDRLMERMDPAHVMERMDHAHEEESDDYNVDVLLGIDLFDRIAAHMRASDSDVMPASRRDFVRINARSNAHVIRSEVNSIINYLGDINWGNRTQRCVRHLHVIKALFDALPFPAEPNNGEIDALMQELDAAQEALRADAGTEETEERVERARAGSPVTVDDEEEI